MRTLIHAVAIPKGDPAEVLELVGGPLDGQRWRVPHGTVEFALAAGESAEVLSLYGDRSYGAPGRRWSDVTLRYKGEVDLLPEGAGCPDDGPVA